MPLSKIDHAIYVADPRFDAKKRETTLGRIGFRDNAIMTCHDGRLLTTGEETGFLLSGILKRHPESLSLVVFDGRLAEGWTTLVHRACAAVLHSAQGHNHDTGEILTSLAQILERIERIREACSDLIPGAKNRAQEQLRAAIHQHNPALRRVMELIRSRLILFLLTNMRSHIKAGIEAKSLKLIDAILSPDEFFRLPKEHTLGLIGNCLRERDL